MTCLYSMVFLIAFATTRSEAAADSFVLIRNAKASTRRLTHAEVKALYTGKAKTFSNEAAVVVIMPEDNEAFDVFAHNIFGVSTKTLISKIKKEVFKGEMSKPLKAVSDDEVIKHVGSSPGAIGVVSARAGSHLPSSVAVLVIGG